ncbi:MAG TPA: nuclear transport factor 2 family protein [Solirubrobacteraceae bacterium]|nr:nuclear transport factor 2 family protein [Solirubrobacteraceae bacterium]
MDPSDVIAIQQLYALYGHVFDDGQLDRLGELFTDDVVFDATADGVPLMHGIGAIVAAAQGYDRHPLAHHLTNVLLTAIDRDTATVRAKVLQTFDGGVAFSGVYDDTLTRTAGGWRISGHAYRSARPTVAAAG